MDVNDPDYAHLFNPLRVRAERIFNNNPEQQHLYVNTFKELFEFDRDFEALLSHLMRTGVVVQNAEGLLQAEPPIQQALVEMRHFIEGQGMSPANFILPNGLLIDEAETEQQEPEERQGEPDYTGDGRPTGAGVWDDVKGWLNKQAYKLLRHHPAFHWMPEQYPLRGSALRPEREL